MAEVKVSDLIITEFSELSFYLLCWDQGHSDEARAWWTLEIMSLIINFLEINGYWKLLLKQPGGRQIFTHAVYQISP